MFKEKVEAKYTIEGADSITDGLMKDKGFMGKRYPRAKRKLSDADIKQLDALYHKLNRMSRSDKDWQKTEDAISKILGYPAEQLDK